MTDRLLSVNFFTTHDISEPVFNLCHLPAHKHLFAPHRSTDVFSASRLSTFLFLVWRHASDNKSDRYRVWDLFYLIYLNFKIQKKGIHSPACDWVTKNTCDNSYFLKMHIDKPKQIHTLLRHPTHSEYHTHTQNRWTDTQTHLFTSFKLSAFTL